MWSDIVIIETISHKILLWCYLYGVYNIVVTMYPAVFILYIKKNIYNVIVNSNIVILSIRIWHIDISYNIIFYILYN